MEALQSFEQYQTIKSVAIVIMLALNFLCKKLVPNSLQSINHLVQAILERVLRANA